MLGEQDAVAKVVSKMRRVPENKDEEGVAKKGLSNAKMGA